MSVTIQEAIDRHGVDVLDHLDRSVTIPVLDGIQFQGDVAVIPATRRVAVTPVPAAGVAVVRGESGGNTHRLVADGRAFFDANPTAGANDLVLGVLTVEPGATGYLAHPEHAYSGIAAGTYELRRQREQANEIRLVQD